jgi:jumonji domain-containing protein 7
LHKDNYENIYCQIIGTKHFVLLPPVAYPCVREENLPSGSYIRQDGDLTIEEESGTDPMPFPTWDPDRPFLKATKYSHLARPVRVTLGPGDMLYLPALWYIRSIPCISSANSLEGTIKYLSPAPLKGCVVLSTTGMI